MIDRPPLPLIILLSGQGTNAQAIIDAINQGSCPAQVNAIISDNPKAYGLKRAMEAHIPSHVFNPKDYSDRESHNQAMIDTIMQYPKGLIVLAGYLRILTPNFIQHFRGRMLNVHPSLLPKYPGLNTYQRALDNQDKQHGTTIHFVTEALDSGPIVTQTAIPICSGDTPKSLAARILVQEHHMYPKVITWYAKGRLRMQLHPTEAAIFDNIVIPKAGPYPS